MLILICSRIVNEVRKLRSTQRQPKLTQGNGKSGILIRVDEWLVSLDEAETTRM